MQRTQPESAPTGVRHEGIDEINPNLAGAGIRVGIVMARFNVNIGEGLLSACTDELLQLGVSPGDIRIVTVPGALEIPLVLQTMAKSGDYDALVALGAVIRGETYHFELVSNEMGAGVTRIGLDTGMPIANGVLTTEDDDQAISRMREKGSDCARTVVEISNLLKAIR